ncbi:hypothetical protein N0V88_005413 [Collariella sp. IMI 366227]|nr:hypothetical protein N0V88_005413 [Collariella sp. IMI 366227]
MVPPRPTKRVHRSISPNPDRYAPSPLNDASFLKSPRSLHPPGHNGDPIPRSTSVDLPSLGEEGQEYAGLANKLSSPPERATSPEHTRTVAEDLKLHAPKPSLPASSAKQRVMTVTRTDSERAASFGIGRPSSIDDSTIALPSNRSLKKKASTTSQLSTADSHFEDEHGIPEIGLRVPMYKNAGDVQAPSPATSASEKGKHHARKTSGLGNLPPGSYGLHGHGVAPQDKLEKNYYEKHPDLLKKEIRQHHSDRPNDFSMSRDDLNKIVRETASRGSGLGVKDYTGTPSEQVGWQALEESASRIASPEVKPVLSPASPGSGTDKESHRKLGDVIHVDEPKRRRSVLFSDTESLKNLDEEVERSYTAPILAEDEVAKDPSALDHQPAVEPAAFELEEIHNRPPSRPTSMHKVSSFELRSTPLEDVEEYEPLFKDDEKKEPKKPKDEKAKKNRFPSADVWEDAPSSAYYTTEVSTPDLVDEQEKPSPAAIPPPREGETPAQAFARHQEELAEKETREHGPKGFIPTRNTQKPLWAQHQTHLTTEKAPGRPAMQQRFPSRDVWEDAPDSLQLETTVSTLNKKKPEGEGEEKEKVLLSDARKGRARGPQRRAPAKAAAPVPVAEEGGEKKVEWGVSKAVTFFEIDPDEGVLSAGAGRKEAPSEGKAEEKAEVKVETEVKSDEVKEDVGSAGEERKKSPEVEAEPELEEKKGIVDMVKDTIKAAVATTAPAAEETKPEGADVSPVEAKEQEGQEGEGKEESKPEAEPEVEAQAEAEPESKANPEAEEKPESSPEPETKALVTNMAGETLISEEVKKEEDVVEPVKVVEEK